MVLDRVGREAELGRDLTGGMAGEHQLDHVPLPESQPERCHDDGWLGLLDRDDDVGIVAVTACQRCAGEHEPLARSRSQSGAWLGSGRSASPCPDGGSDRQHRHGERTGAPCAEPVRVVHECGRQGAGLIVGSEREHCRPAWDRGRRGAADCDRAQALGDGARHGGQEGSLIGSESGSPDRSVHGDDAPHAVP